MIKVEVSLFPESRGYEVHSFETLAEAKAFCAKNPDAEIVDECQMCHGAGWYKEEAAPVTRECDCQDRAALTAIQAPINQELLDALKYAHSQMQPFCSDEIVKKAIARAEAQKGGV